jgi:YesN/AraC family two-component response regulator
MFSCIVKPNFIPKIGLVLFIVVVCIICRPNPYSARMKYYIKYNITQACKVIVSEQLTQMGLSYNMDEMGELELKKLISNKELEDINQQLSKYGIELIDDQKSRLVNKIKDIIMDKVNADERGFNTKFSVYLSEKLNHSYGYLANLFSEVTCTTIENFLILQKIERVKQLLIEDNLTLTQIADMLEYSSVAHLSNQFKKTTGLTPSMFQRIIKKRKEYMRNA